LEFVFAPPKSVPKGKNTMSFSRRVITLPIFSALILLGSLLLSVPGTALAHGQVTVGDYELEIGFHIEPPYAGIPNGLDLFVTNSKTNENVNGLEQTLNVEIIRGSHKKTLALYPQDEVDGAYTADIVPTEAGDYTWHVWGTIEGTPVDVAMTSAPDTFSPVQSLSDAAFPDNLPDVAQIQTQANTAMTVGIAGVVIGIVGLLVGVTGLRSARTAKKA
jgi:hypothetical protein